MLDDASRTNASLLGRVCQGARDQEAWADFVDRYAPKIYAWCRAWRLQEADAQDVTQAVLMKLARQMERFRYDPGRSFRGWLRTLTENAWRDWLADRDRAARRGEFFDGLAGVEAREDLARRLEEEYDLELLEEAERRVRARVSATTWDAYRMTARDGVAADDAAGRLGLSVAAVFKAKSNVLKRLREAVRDLERPGGAEADAG